MHYFKPLAHSAASMLSLCLINLKTTTHAHSTYHISRVQQRRAFSAYRKYEFVCVCVCVRGEGGGRGGVQALVQQDHRKPQEIRGGGRCGWAEHGETCLVIS